MSDREQWRRAVERGLEGASFESLVKTTLDGIPIEPLYDERDRPQAEGMGWPPRARRAIGVYGAPTDLEDLGRHGVAVVVVDRAPTTALAAGVEAIVRPSDDEPLRPDVRWALDPWLPEPSEERAARLVAAVRADRDALGVDAACLAERGATAVDEVGLAAASLVQTMRHLERAGLDLERAVRGASVLVGLGVDFFGDIAKLRALRRVIARVLDVAAVRARPQVVGLASERVQSRSDPSTNLIRHTIGVVAGLIGGADVVASRPHAIDARDQAAVDRIARNVALVALLEAHVADCDDAARGSYFLERFTHEIATRAWAVLQEVDARGGLLAAMPWVRERLEASRRARARAVATRRMPIVGVSRFPWPERREACGDGMRDAAPFEALLPRAVALARCIVLEGCPQARVDFAHEVARLAAREVDVVRDLAIGEAALAIVCAPDADLGGAAVAAVAALKRAGARAIALAGRPGPHEQPLREAGVDAFLFAGADLVEALGTLLDRAGGAA